MTIVPKRNKSGTAAALIMQTLEGAETREMLRRELVAATGLPEATFGDNMLLLERSGRIKRFKDDIGRTWVALPQ